MIKIEQAMEIQFEMMARQWHKETRMHSSAQQIMKHPLAEKVENLGSKNEVIHLIMKDLRENGTERSHMWFGLLAKMTNECPIPYEDRGYVEKMKDHWLNWGSLNNHI